ncbi:MFS transporter [Amycolatopsis endophytica]|uniref:MFS family permease n=1 Tax=Amycolatopsis endophytica TaxID=860233 RepID=A0A853B8E1_9PSEU|nr:MFS transporter [Amycolatopsis endophytica]NYI91578.1 MFS family permease [Amycolatopsis endophytica]
MTTRERTTPGGRERWVRIGLLLAVGLFVAYLDRSNLSIGIKGVARDLDFAGGSFPAVSSLTLTAFLWGYLASNLLGGFLTGRFDAKWILLVSVAGYSLCTLAIGFSDSVPVLVALRIGVGVFEGFYWPQQFRLAKEWFDEREMSRASALIQYYGQYLALALGFFLLTPVYSAWDWRPLFWLLGGIGLVVIVPLYAVFLRSRPGVPRFAPVRATRTEDTTRERLTFAALGGWRFLLIVFSYFANGMLFWGITLFLPQTVSGFGLSPMLSGLASATPYLVSLVLTVPMIALSDRTGKRGPIAVSGLVVGGILIACLPFAHSAPAQFVLISLGVGYFTAAYTPNIWAIAVTRLSSTAVGPATGIINGFGAGGGGIVAGWLVGALLAATGSYFPGFAILGVVAIAGGIALAIYVRSTSNRPSETQLVEQEIG